MANEALDRYGDKYVLCIGAQSPDKRIIIKGNVFIDMGMFHGAYGSGMNHGEPMLNYLSRGGIECQEYQCSDKYATISEFDFSMLSGMKPINPYAMTTASKNYKELKCFEYKDESPSIYIPPQNENELLDMILKIQYPNQQEIKKRLILPEVKPIIKARIFTLAA